MCVIHYDRHARVLTPFVAKLPCGLVASHRGHVFTGYPHVRETELTTVYTEITCVGCLVTMAGGKVDV